MTMSAYLAIQCSFKDQGRGTFLYAGAESYRDPAAFLVSPMMRDCVALFAWTKANGWTRAPHDSTHPVGVYMRTEA